MQQRSVDRGSTAVAAAVSSCSSWCSLVSEKNIQEERAGGEGGGRGEVGRGGGWWEFRVEKVVNGGWKKGGLEGGNPPNHTHNPPNQPNPSNSFTQPSNPPNPPNPPNLHNLPNHPNPSNPPQLSSPTQPPPTLPTLPTPPTPPTPPNSFHPPNPPNPGFEIPFRPLPQSQLPSGIRLQSASQ